MIYIQSNTERTLPHHFDVSCALYGAEETASDYRLTSFEEVESGKFDNLIKNHLFVGSVEFMREVFNRIGIQDVRVPKNSNREHEILTLREAHEFVSGGAKLFIKPLEIKLFTGLILDGCVYSCLENLPGDTKVMAYAPFTSEILSESRVYIHNHRIIDVRNYSGDPFIYPEESYCNDMVSINSDTFPKAYTMDVAVMDEQNNNGHEIVEYNDMWAIGNYGMPNDLYVRLLRDRYFEIVK